MTSSASMEGFLDLFINFGFLVGALPALLAGIFVVRTGHKLAGFLLIAGAAMVSVEMLIWIGDSVLLMFPSRDPFAGTWTDNFYYVVVMLGVVGTLMIGVGVLLLAMAFRNALRLAEQYRAMVEAEAAPEPGR